jgi:membrane protein YdbS with pleckstrin-like domain
MFELFKIFWDVVVIRDGARKGHKLTRGNVIIAVGFVVLLYATGLPAVILYQNHPQYKWVFIADGILFIAMMVWEIKWYMKQRAAQVAGPAPTNQPGQ